MARALRSARLEGGLAPIATAERGVVASVRSGRWLARPTPTTLWLAGAVVLAAVLRFSTLSLQSFDLDESVTVALLHQGFHATLTTIPITEKTPPLYYVLAWLWSQVFGLNEAGLRSFSALAGTLTVLLAYDAGKQLVSKRTGLIAAGLTATSPFLVWYSQEARAYALLGLVATGSFVLFVRLLARPTARLMAAWALVSALALATHYFAVFLVVPEILWLPVRVRPRRYVVLAGGVVGLVGLALLPLARQQAHHFHRKEAFLGTPLVSRIMSIPVQFLLGTGTPSGDSKLMVVAIGGAFVLSGLLGLVYYADRRTVSAAGLASLVGAVALLVPMGLALLGVDYLDPRNLLPAWLPLLMVPAAGFAISGYLGLLGAGGLLAVFLVMVVAVNADQNLQRANYRDAVAMLAQIQGPEAIVVSPSYNWTPLTYYLPSAPAMSTDTASVRSVVLLGWRGEQLRGAAVRLLARHGFRLVKQQSAQELRLVVFRSHQATPLSRRFLDRSRLGSAHPMVLIRQPPASRAS